MHVAQDGRWLRSRSPRAPTASSPMPTATATGSRSSRRAQHGHLLRARHDAILVGHRHGARRRSAADLPPAGIGASLAGARRARYAIAASAVIATRAHGARTHRLIVFTRRAKRRRGACGARRRDCPCRQGRKRAAGLMAPAARACRRGDDALLVEGGPALHAAFPEPGRGRYRLHLYRAPIAFGARASRSRVGRLIEAVWLKRRTCACICARTARTRRPGKL